LLLQGKQRLSGDFAKHLTSNESDLVNAYKLHFMYPGTTREVSSVVAGLGFVSVAFVPLLLWKGAHLEAAVIGANWFLVGPLSHKLSPLNGLKGLARRGQAVAMQRLESWDSAWDKILELQRHSPAANLEPESQTMMDAFVSSVYGGKKTTTANLSLAIDLVNDELLMGRFQKEEIADLATALNRGPVPYSTHDLAASVALGLLRRAPKERRKELFDVQLQARLTVGSWAAEGKVVPPLAEAFEQTLYKDYHPSAL
jgi:hypothetical protein